MASPLDRHEKIACLVSGGKDSTAVVHLLKEQLHRITVYHVDTGDQLPEQQEAVDRIEAICPRFIRVQTNVRAWIAQHGIPTDLLPHSSHPIAYLFGKGTRTKLVARYDCCWSNIMQPAFIRAHADGCTLLIRGTKRSDMPTLPAGDGHIDPTTKIEIWLPIVDWTDADVLAFLTAREVPISRFYQFGLHGAPDCGHCTAWWDEGRGAYLRKYHPEVWQEYRAKLRLIRSELEASLQLLKRETGDVRVA